RLNVPKSFAPFVAGGFPTPSGKCELYSESLAAEGHPAVPDFVPPKESRRSAPDLASRYPLALISPASHAFLNSSFANLPKHLKKERSPFLELHPTDAAARGIEDGA